MNLLVNHYLRVMNEELIILLVFSMQFIALLESENYFYDDQLSQLERG
ncbi:hypothetical protein NVIRPANT_00800 [Pantoea sp. Nvir]|nr:hypothetical protein NVIRPANT_00800 [Pantoea sp. Nvir]